MKNRRWFVALLVLFTACTKVIELDLPQEPPLLVINSLINPDSSLRVHLSHTRQATDGKSYPVADAQIEIWQNENRCKTLIYQDSGWYGSDVFPEEGNRYEVCASSTGYAPVSARDTLPLKAAIAAGWYFYWGEDAFGDIWTEVHLSIADPPEVDNYYEIVLFQMRYNQHDSSYYRKYPGGLSCGYATVDPILAAEGDVEFEPCTVVLSDRLFQGETHECVFRVKNQFNSDFVAILRTTSRSYYEYRKSWMRHRFYRGVNPLGGSDPGFDYTDVPFTVFNNIEGGYGIFAGYTADSLVMEHRP